MLSKNQFVVLVLLSCVLWVAATLYIRFLPTSLILPVSGSLAYVTTFPIAWLSVWLTKAVGRLSADQLLPGVAVVGAVAMMIDGVALRWFSGVFSPDDTTTRLGAAWLLWGYGVSFAIALIVARQLRRKTA